MSMPTYEGKTIAVPSRLEAITDAVVSVFSSRMSAGQLHRMKRDIQTAILRAVDDLEVAGREDDSLYVLRPLAEWHEDMGPAIWWLLPIKEPPYCGTPLDSDWPGYHTHWSSLPNCQRLSATDGVSIQ